MKEKVLVIWSSINKKNKSYSYALVKRFIKYYQERNKNNEIEWLDLNNIEMAKKTISNTNFNNFFNEKDSDVYINQLKKINKVVFACPMINFNIPTLSKNYLDHILVANKTFSYKYTTKGASIGLLSNLKVQILTTQGAPIGWYKWGNLGSYLEGTWKFVGANVTDFITLGGTKLKENSSLTPEEFIDKYNNIIKKAAEKF